MFETMASFEFTANNFLIAIIIINTMQYKYNAIEFFGCHGERTVSSAQLTLMRYYVL